MKKLLSEAAIRAKRIFLAICIILQHIVGKGSFNIPKEQKR